MTAKQLRAIVDYVRAVAVVGDDWDLLEDLADAFGLEWTDLL